MVLIAVTRIVAVPLVTVLLLALPVAFKLPPPLVAAAPPPPSPPTRLAELTNAVLRPDMGPMSKELMGSFMDDRDTSAVEDTAPLEKRKTAAASPPPPPLAVWAFGLCGLETTMWLSASTSVVTYVRATLGNTGACCTN